MITGSVRALLLTSLATLVAGGSALAAGLLQRAPAVPAQPSYDPAEWHLVANHTHSSTGIGHYKPEGLKKIFELAARKGIAMVIVTDHNTLGHWYDPLFVPTGGVIPVRGMEWTSDDGHANIVDFTSESPDDVIVPCDWEGAPAPCGSAGIDYAPMVESVQARDGLVIINHPRLARHYWPDDAFGADAVEVNGNLTDRKGTKGRQWWHERLSEGARLTAMGGSDWHYWRPFSGDEPPDGEGDGHDDHHCTTETMGVNGWPKPSFEDAVNLVRMSTPSVAALREAIRAHHILVLRDPSEPRVFLGADVDGDGSFDEVRAGDQAPGGDAATLRVQLRVLGGDGKDLNVFLSHAPAEGGRVDEVSTVEVVGDDFVVGFELPRGRPGESFLRAEIETGGDAVSNPIYY